MITSFLFAALLSSQALCASITSLSAHLHTDPDCGTENQVWLAQGSVLLYQAMVPANGSFEFYIKPGNYNLTVTDNKGCLIETDVTATTGMRLDLSLKPRKVSQARLSRSANRTPASSDCPTCGTYNAPPVLAPQSNYGMPILQPNGYYPMPTYFPYQMPYWAGYGALSYNNFYSPGAYSNGGITSSYYPQGGQVFAGKPNLYIEAPAGISLRIKVGLKAPLNTWLMAVPIHGDSGWVARTRNEEKFSVAKADYPYFFYDLRIDSAPLQDEKGFCADRETLIPKLTTSLIEAGFNAIETKDFEEYWALKIPKSERICAYPQDAVVLDALVPLTVTPTPRSVTRLQFVLVPKESMTARTGKFSKEPHSDYNFKDLRARALAPRSPASTTAPQLREWGIGFLAEPETK